LTGPLRRIDVSSQVGPCSDDDELAEIVEGHAINGGMIDIAAFSLLLVREPESTTRP
jgi:hypothetical protein